MIRVDSDHYSPRVVLEYGYDVLWWLEYINGAGPFLASTANLKGGRGGTSTS